MTREKILPVVSALFITFFLCRPVHSQPQLQEVLADAQVVENPECATVTISFSSRMRYKKHFPLTSGDELRIQLEPIVFTSEKHEAVHHQESLVPPDSEIAALDQISYEGDANGGAFLILTFDHAVSYSVEQGKGFDSIEITVFLPSATRPCSP